MHRPPRAEHAGTTSGIEVGGRGGGWGHAGRGSGCHRPGIQQMAPKLLLTPDPRVTTFAVSTHSRARGNPPSPSPQPSPAPCPSSGPHLCGPAHGDSSRPSPSGGPGHPGPRAPAARSCSLSPGGSLEAGGLTGGVAAGPGGRAWRGRGAGPGAAVAVTKRVVSTGERGRWGSALQNLYPQLGPHTLSR